MNKRSIIEENILVVGNISRTISRKITQNREIVKNLTLPLSA
jgi:hypothetical protein